ncbi:MAG: ArsR family transcriptional regulator [Armatimonadota bacterium]|nr:ArsR family transcriptional regulator [Armatimonadota bacterium]
MKPSWNKRFLASTRGRIVGLLRSQSRTVNELAEALCLTDNAVRAHLSTLERDGLVQQSGVRPGLRKPHYAYELTPEAEHLFPKSYGPLLNQLLSVLKERLSSQEIDAMLREMGRRVAAPHAAAVRDGDLEWRVEEVVQAFGELGGLPDIEDHDGHIFIRGDSCPFAALVAEHPEVCRLAETVVAEIVGAPVQERCKHDGALQCCFEIMADRR